MANEDSSCPAITNPMSAHTGAGHQDDVAEQSKRPDHAAQQHRCRLRGDARKQPPLQ